MVLFANCWRHFRDALWPDQRRYLVDFLRAEYANEASDVAHFREHASQMIYPRFRERLLRISEEEKAHVDWLQDKIRSLGGTISETNLTIKYGRNSWECLLMDAEAENRDYAAILQRNLAEQTDPEIAQGLRRIHEDEKRHRAEILDMLMRSDPQASLVGDAFSFRRIPPKLT